jgi:hypothetical protein
LSNPSFFSIILQRVSTLSEFLSQDSDVQRQLALIRKLLAAKVTDELLEQLLFHALK